MNGFILNRCVLGALLVLLMTAGCARFPGGLNPDDLPERVLVVDVDFASRILDDYYYYFAIDDDGDDTDGPLPVAVGPFWGNGWGTGSMSYFVEYHAGEFRVYKPAVVASLVPGSGNPNQAGIQSVSGVPMDSLAGTHVIDIEAINLGETTVSPAGTISAVTNGGQQAAGTLTLETDGAGAIVAGSVAFTPAEIGGRLLTTAQNTRLAELNGGGETLDASTLTALNLNLEMADAPVAGMQTLTIAPTTADIVDRFEAFFGTGDYTERGQIYANETHEGPTPVLPGVLFTVGDLTNAVDIKVVTQFDVTPDYIGPPFDVTPPGTSGEESRKLGFVLDLVDIGDPQGKLDINFIATDELILDPEVLGPKLYDGLGYTGNGFITIRTDINFIYDNQEASEPERTGDTPRASIDIKDWQVEVRLTRIGP